MPINIKPIVSNIPEVKKPTEKKLTFNTKLKWTLIVLGAFFVLANIPLFGVSENFLSRFDFLEIVLGTDFGSIITLGIGPIVTASIILQLLVGAGILKIDVHSDDGKKYFQGLQKIAVLFFIVFESAVFVLMGGVQAAPGFTGLVIFQLILGGLSIMYLDEVVQKWGFGSGISLFIVAGVAWRLFTSLFQFFGSTGENCLTDFSNTQCSGSVFVIIQSIINSAPKEALAAAATILVTALIFLVVVWAQSLKVEIPLSYDRIRGYNMKWPLAFFYASNIPVILVAAFAANIQLFASLLQTALKHPTFLGDFSNGQPVNGLAFYLSHSNIVDAIIKGTLSFDQIFNFAQGFNISQMIVVQTIVHVLFYMSLSALFAVFWVKTSGMDESSQAKNILSSGLQIPGFRKDERVLESILKRYILPLTIMGGLAVGLLASVADLLGALTGGTSILLSVMIIYQLYQNIAQTHAVDMHPALKKMMS